MESSDLPGLDISGRVLSGVPHVVSSPTFSFQDWLGMGQLAQELERA